MRHDFANFIQRRLSVEADLNYGSLAARWGVPQNSLWRWINRRGSPSSDVLMEICRRMRPDELMDLLAMLAGGKALVFPADPAEASTARPETLREVLVELQRHVADLGACVQQCLRDGRIDGIDQSRLIGCSNQVRSSLNRMGLIAASNAARVAG